MLADSDLNRASQWVLSLPAAQRPQSFLCAEDAETLLRAKPNRD
jgi:hypothetical protein